MAAFAERTLDLQLFIDRPESVSEAARLDALTVTFYGTDFFRAATTGTRVRFATQLKHSLLRLVSADDGQSVESLRPFHSLAVASFALAAPLVCLGDPLPTWLFVHALQLVAHTPLLNSAMPGNVQYFLKDYLSMARLQVPLDDVSKRQDDFSD